jgi:hypothetical protein
MPASPASAPDWRSKADYAALLDADRPLFAWEWLRRDPAYVEAWSRAAASGPSEGLLEAQRFGLVALEDPGLAVPTARPLWRRDAHPFVLQTARAPGGCAEDRFDARRFSALATLVSTPLADHLLLSDGLRSIRLDGEAGLFGGGPVTLAYALQGFGRAERPLLTLRRLLALSRSGRFSRSLHAREARSTRWVRLLRTWDALQSGASQREIAQILLSASAAGADWRIREPSLRLQAQRLVRLARAMAAGGYRALLL